ncbi:MAG: N-acetylmuramoyl-L-alanine amidase [Actinobacteria bacterium]|nr:N-acetylmuramoyl-L-alanine amidase [Actinomycetota bacterium]
MKNGNEYARHLKIYLLVLLLVLLLSPDKCFSQIIIDPGHGGYDPGAAYNEIQEKNINLSIAKQVFEYLKNQGFETTLTRDTDIYLSLSNRLTLVEQGRTIAFISIHCNSFTDPRVRGVEVYYQSANPNSYQLAKSIFDNFACYTNLPLRKIEAKNYFVLSENQSTAVLVECGFLSNTYDREYLLSQDGREKIVRAISEGIINYFSKVYPNGLDKMPAASLLNLPSYSSSTTNTTRISLQWVCTTETTSFAFDLEYRPNYSSTFVRLLSSTTQTAYTFSGSQGLTYYFRVRAKDKAGNISPWSTVKSTSIPYDDTNSLFTLSSGWKKASGPYRFLGSSSYTTLKGKYFKLKQGLKLYSVKEVAIIVTKSPYGGKANVYLNGKLIKTIDTYASKNTYRVPLIIKTYTTPTTIYDLRVVTTGTKNTYSKGYFVDIDGVGVKR